MPETARECIVGLTRGIAKSASLYGYRFCRLEKCCDLFEKWFIGTGNRKITSFNHHEPTEEKYKSGIHLETRNALAKVLLKVTLSKGVDYESEVNSCPFCGAEVKVECVKAVVLTEKFEQVRAGFDEYVFWSKDKDTSTA